jgi:hypothetical protein
MSNGLGITAVSATTLLAAATNVVHGGDYSAIAQADQSARSVQRWAQASQLSQTAEPSMPAVHLGQESSPGTAASSVGNLPLNPHSGTPAVVLDDQEVSAILGKGVGSNAGEDMGRIVDVTSAEMARSTPPLSTSAGSSASARARLPSIGMRLISIP